VTTSTAQSDVLPARAPCSAKSGSTVSVERCIATMSFSSRWAAKDTSFTGRSMWNPSGVGRYEPGCAYSGCGHFSKKSDEYHWLVGTGRGRPSARAIGAGGSRSPPARRCVV
jgi:hypothetical protein